MHPTDPSQDINQAASGLRTFYGATSVSPKARFKHIILSLPGIWPALIPIKLLKAYQQVMKPQVLRSARTAFSSREVCNFSYHHTEASACRLVGLLATQLDGMTPDLVSRYCSEARHNPTLQDIYRTARLRDKLLRNLTDADLRVGRQLLYYCLVRALKPRFVFEAGTAHGVGALLILHALLLNQEEGWPGRLTTVDMNPNAGRLLHSLPDTYRNVLDVRHGSSEDVLAKVQDSIDLFFHDTADIAVHEMRHYALLRGKLSSVGVICTTWGAAGRLAAFSQQHDRRYFEFTNEAAGHWSCDTLGVSMPLRTISGKAAPYATVGASTSNSFAEVISPA